MLLRILEAKAAILRDPGRDDPPVASDASVLTCDRNAANETWVAFDSFVTGIRSLKEGLMGKEPLFP